MRQLIAVGVLAVWSSVAAGAIVEVSGRVMDREGKPVVGARVAENWFSDQGAALAPGGTVRTDSEGRFSMEMEFHGRDRLLMAVDSTGHRGGVAVIPVKKPGSAIQIEMGPLVDVRWRFTCEESGQVVGATFASMELPSDRLRVAAGRSGLPIFAMKLPARHYHFRGGDGNRYVDATREVTLVEGQPVDLGAIDLKLTPKARLFGKEPPAWHITDARGVSKNARPSDYKGKWLVLDFWGYWCGPCVGRSLPGWIDFAEDHAADRDKFEIITIHDPKATDFAMLDAKLEPIVRREWRGRSLPFPIVLDTTGKTVEAYGIEHWPTVVLVDPQGHVADFPVGIGFDAEDFLKSKLPPLPVNVRVARALDRTIGLANDDDGTLAELIHFFYTVGRIRLRMDPDALKTAGIDKDTLVPLKLNANLTLRAWLNLTLDPFGLTYVADNDGGLRIVRSTAENTAISRPSPRQQAENARVREFLKSKVSLDFKQEPLGGVGATLTAMTGESFVLDPVAWRSGAIDPKTTVAGSAREEAIGLALRRLLEPLGMTLVVRDEVVMFTSAKPNP
jgi:thiol-disulfide isomerase/thioredoxin